MYLYLKRFIQEESGAEVIGQLCALACVVVLIAIIGAVLDLVRKEGEVSQKTINTKKSISEYSSLVGEGDIGGAIKITK